MVPVIIHTDQVRIFIEDKFMDIPQAMGKDFKIASIRVGSHNHAFIGVFPFLSIRTNAIETYVSHRPIDPAVRTYFQSGHVVAAKADMDTITMGNGLLLIHNRSEERRVGKECSTR